MSQAGKSASNVAAGQGMSRESDAGRNRHINYVESAEHVYVSENIHISNQSGTQLKDELRVFLVGPTGAGKSSSGNTILNKEIFRVEASFSSVTVRGQKETGEEDGVQLVVMDTPGYFDTDSVTWVPNELIGESVVQAFRNLPPGPHAILFTISITSHSMEDINAFERMAVYFGKGILQYTIILFTHGDEPGYDANYIQKKEEFQDILKQCGERYVIINNKNPADRNQVKTLIEKIKEFGKLHFCSAEDLPVSKFKEDYYKIENQRLKELLAKRDQELAETKGQLDQRETELAQIKGQLADLQL